MSPGRTYLLWEARRGLGAALPAPLRIALLLVPALALTVLTAWIGHLSEHQLDLLPLVTWLAAFLAVALAAAAPNRPFPAAIRLAGVSVDAVMWSRAASNAVRVLTFTAPAALLAGAGTPRRLLLFAGTTWSAAAMATAIKARFSHGLPAPLRRFSLLLGVVLLDWIALDALMRGPYSSAYSLAALWSTLRQPGTDRGVAVVAWLEGSDGAAPAGGIPASIPWVAALLLGGITALAMTAQALRRHRSAS